MMINNNNYNHFNRSFLRNLNIVLLFFFYNYGRGQCKTSSIIEQN